MGKLLGVTSYPDPLPRDLDWKVVMTLRVSSITLSIGRELATMSPQATSPSSSPSTLLLPSTSC